MFAFLLQDMSTSKKRSRDEMDAIREKVRKLSLVVERGVKVDGLADPLYDFI